MKKMLLVSAVLVSGMFMPSLFGKPVKTYSHQLTPRSDLKSPLTVLAQIDAFRKKHDQENGSCQCVGHLVEYANQTEEAKALLIDALVASNMITRVCDAKHNPAFKSRHEERLANHNRFVYGWYTKIGVLREDDDLKHIADVCSHVYHNMELWNNDELIEDTKDRLNEAIVGLAHYYKDNEESLERVFDKRMVLEKK